MPSTQSLGVPYSEHSSFFELTCFALSCPGPDVRMIATVNVGNEKRSVDPASQQDSLVANDQSSKNEEMVRCALNVIRSVTDWSCRFEKWQAEKMRRKEQKLPAIVDYRDETYVSV